MKSNVYEIAKYIKIITSRKDICGPSKGKRRLKSG